MVAAIILLLIYFIILTVLSAGGQNFIWRQLQIQILLSQQL